MKASYAHLIIWVIIFTVTVTAHGYWYVEIANKSVAVAELQSQIDTKTETASRISSARAALAGIAEDEAAVQNYFVPETGVVSFINDLERRAKGESAALKVLSVVAGGGTKQPVLTFVLAVEGAFDAVMRTIGAVEFAPYDLRITKFSMSENGKGVWHANFEIMVGSVSAVSTSTSTPVAPPKAISLLL